MQQEKQPQIPRITSRGILLAKKPVLRAEFHLAFAKRRFEIRFGREFRIRLH